MAYGLTDAGVRKPVNKSEGILYWAEAGTVDLSTLKITSDLIEAGFKDAGSLGEEAVTITQDADDPEVYRDFNQNAVDTGTASSTKSVKFVLNQMRTYDTLQLVFNKNDIKQGTEGYASQVTSKYGNPTNKTFVIKTAIKGQPMLHVIHEASFASRGDENYVNDQLASWEVNYTILTDSNGEDITYIYGE